MIRISFTSLTTKALADLAKQTLVIAQDSKYTMTEGRELLQNVVNQYEAYNLTYNKLAFSGKGKSVAELDKQRDVIYSKIKAYLKGYIQVETLPNHAQAVSIYDYFKLYGLQLTSLTYAEESAQLTQLIADLNTSENLQKLEDLGIKNLFEQLKTAQTEFEKTFTEQIQSNAELRKLPSASESRALLQDALRSYYTFVSVMKPIGNWQMLYRELNELVKSAKPISSKVEKKEEKSEK